MASLRACRFDAFTSLMGDAESSLGLQYIQLDYIAGNSVSTEIGRSVTKDMKLIVLSVIIFFVVAVLGFATNVIVLRVARGVAGHTWPSLSP